MTTRRHARDWLAGLLLIAACGKDGSGRSALDARPSSDAPGIVDLQATGDSTRDASNTALGGTGEGGGAGAGTGGANATGGAPALDAAGMDGTGGRPALDAWSGAGGALGAGGAPASGGGTGSGGATGIAGSSGTGGVGRTDASAGDAGKSDAGSDLGLEAKPDAVADAPLQDDVPSPIDDAQAMDSPAASKTTCLGPPSAALANAALPSGYCAWTWASNLNTPRGITRNARGDMLVVERGANRISLLHDDNGDGVSDSSERVVLTTLSGLNHGIAINGGYLYASTSSAVYRWAYDGGRAQLGSSQTVVTGIPSSGHSTRTLLFDGEGRLYVSVGSGSNVDANSSRARIVRYPASALGSSSTFAQGEVFADGLRNEVGLGLDGQGRIWGVENGRDELNRTDLGGDIHNDNPGEEVNLFAEPGKFYGYPYCWSEFLLASGMGAGTQWADPQFMNDGTHTDTWCRSTTNVVPPVLVLQAHTAPLDIKFYSGGAFPEDMLGSAIVSSHGSWNRSTPTGYKLVRIPFGADGMPNGAPSTLLEYAGSGDTGGDWPHRPVGIEAGQDGRLFVTSDASNIVIAIGYDGG